MNLDGIGIWGLAWGAGLAAAMVIYGLIFRGAKLSYRSGWSWVFYVLPPIAALLAQLSLRAAAGELPFGTGFALAAIVIVAGSAVYGAFVFLYNRFVDDSLIRTVVSDRVTQLEARVTDPEKRARAIRRVRAAGTPAAFAANVTIALIVISMAVATVLTIVAT